MNTLAFEDAPTGTEIPITEKLRIRAERLAQRPAKAAALEAEAATLRQQVAEVPDKEWARRGPLRDKAETLEAEAAALRGPTSIRPITPEEFAAVAAIERAFAPLGGAIRISLASEGGFIAEWQAVVTAPFLGPAEMAAAKRQIAAAMAETIASARQWAEGEINCEFDWAWEASGRRTRRERTPIAPELVTARLQKERPWVLKLTPEAAEETTADQPAATRFENLTPHSVADAISGQTFPPSGTVARVAATFSPAGEAGGVQMFRRSFGAVEGLPDKRQGVLLIVSALVAAATPDRDDLVSPGELVRGPDGQPIGCKGFVIA
jgi:hypothetical protein